jgi:hypothetical protein
MTKLFLLPGGLICDAVGLTEGSDNNQILRCGCPEHAELGRGRSDHDPAASILNRLRPRLLRPFRGAPDRRVLVQTKESSQ